MLRTYYEENRDHLMAWEPERDDVFYKAEYWQTHVSNSRTEFETDKSIQLIALNNAETAIMGVCNFTNISRGVFQACNLGYSIHHAQQGSGLMHEILVASLDYIFTRTGIHRVMANYVPENERSGQLLQRLGFEIEGYAKSYLMIAGEWRDHVLTAKINPYVA